MFSQNTTSGNAVLCWGRFQPPHAGHIQLLNTGLEMAGDNFFFAMSRKITKNSPLSFELRKKLVFVQSEQLISRLLEGPHINTVFTAATEIYKKYAPAHAEQITLSVLADEIRAEELKNALNRYNGVQSTHGFYQFKTIDAVYSKRDVKHDDVINIKDKHNISGTLVRELASSGKYDRFSKCFLTSDSNVILELYNELRNESI